MFSVYVTPAMCEPIRSDGMEAQAFFAFGFLDDSILENLNGRQNVAVAKYELSERQTTGLTRVFIFCDIPKT